MSYDIDLNISGSSFQILNNRHLIDTSLNINMRDTSHLSTDQVPIISETLLSNTSHSTYLSPKFDMACCVWCKTDFALLDNSCGISLQNIDKQHVIFKIKPTLEMDSYICGQCLKLLENTNELYNLKKLIIFPVDETNIPIGTEINIKRNRNSKADYNVDICSVHGCTNISIHPIPLDECKQIKHIFSLFESSRIILIESKNKFKRMNCPASVCDKHIHLINNIQTCQLCCNKLNFKYLNTEDWKLYEKWNLTMLHYDIPLKLLPGMFICKRCQTSILEDSFSKFELEILQKNVERRNDIRIQLFGTPYDNDLEPLILENVDSPIVIASKLYSRSLSKIKFTDPLIFSTYYFSPDDNERIIIYNSYFKNIFPLTIRNDIKCDSYDYYCILDLKSHFENTKDFVITKPLKPCIKKNESDSLINMNSKNAPANSDHNPHCHRTLEMMGLVAKTDDIKLEHSFSKLHKDDKDNLFAIKTPNDTNQNGIDKNIMLENEKSNDIVNNIEHLEYYDQNKLCVKSKNDVHIIKNLATNIKKPVNTDIDSSQIICVVNPNENCMLVNSKRDFLGKLINPNRSDLIPAHLNNIKTYSVVIGRKQSNVKNQRIEMKRRLNKTRNNMDVKKQRLCEISKFNDSL